jgi:hypothetical protein
MLKRYVNLEQKRVNFHSNVIGVSTLKPKGDDNINCYRCDQLHKKQQYIFDYMFSFLSQNY